MVHSSDPRNTTIEENRRVGMTHDDAALCPCFVAPGFSHYADEYARLKKIKWSKSTRRHAALVLRLFGDFSRDRWPPAPGDIINWLNDLDERGRSPATLDNYYRYLAAFLRFAYKMQWLEDDLPARIKELDLAPDEPTDEPKRS